MSKNRFIITILAFFMLLGIISLAMGATSIQCKSQNMKMAWSTPNAISSTDIHPEKVRYLRSLTGTESSEAYLDGAVTGWVNVNLTGESNTLNILKSAYLENASVNVAFSNGEIKSVWFLTNGDLTEPTPTSVNIPTVLNTTISNVYSASDIDPGSMAYIDSKVNGVNIGWVRINSNGEQGINVLNILDAARSTHKNVILTTNIDGFITSAGMVP